MALVRLTLLLNLEYESMPRVVLVFIRQRGNDAIVLWRSCFAVDFEHAAELGSDHGRFVFSAAIVDYATAWRPATCNLVRPSSRPHRQFDPLHPNLLHS